jgi:hypothetical protein
VDKDSGVVQRDIEGVVVLHGEVEHRSRTRNPLKFPDRYDITIGSQQTFTALKVRGFHPRFGRVVPEPVMIGRVDRLHTIIGQDNKVKKVVVDVREQPRDRTDGCPSGRRVRSNDFVTNRDITDRFLRSVGHQDQGVCPE